MITPESENSVTELLQRYFGGDRAAAEALFREIFPTLHRLAVRQLDRERYATPLSPTELINELWLRSLKGGGFSVNNREHFYAVAALAMRRVLVDLARNRLAQSRGAGQIPSSLDDVPGYDRAKSHDLQRIIEIGQLMERLEEQDPMAARIVDMRYFAGYTIEEVAELTGLAERHVRYRWKKSLGWLRKQLGD